MTTLRSTEFQQQKIETEQGVSEEDNKFPFLPFYSEWEEGYTSPYTLAHCASGIMGRALSMSAEQYLGANLVFELWENSRTGMKTLDAINRAAPQKLWPDFSRDSSPNVLSDITAGYLCYKATDFVLRKKN